MRGLFNGGASWNRDRERRYHLSSATLDAKIFTRAARALTPAIGSPSVAAMTTHNWRRIEGLLLIRPVSSDTGPIPLVVSRTPLRCFVSLFVMPSIPLSSDLRLMRGRRV